MNPNTGKTTLNINQTEGQQGQQQQQQQQQQAPPPAPAKGDKDAIALFSKRFLTGGETRQKEPAPGQKPDDGKPTAAPDSTQTPPKEEKPTATPPARKPAAQQQRRPAAKPPEQPSVEKIVEAAAEGVVRAMDKREATKGKEKEDFQLPPAEQRKLQVLEQMEKLYGDQYKELAKNYRESIKESLEYAQKWEEENPGQEFNEDDPEHEEFFEKNGVRYEDDHYLEALTELKVSERMPKVEEQLQSKIKNIERQEEIRQKEKVIDLHQARSARAFFTSLGEGFEGFEEIIGEDGSVNKEALAKLQEQDPDAFDIAIAYAGRKVEPVAAEIFKLYDGLAELDLKRPDHKWINDFAISAEQMIQAQPEDKQRDEHGRMFATVDDYAKMTDAQRRNHWVLTAVELSALAANELSNQAKEVIDSERKKRERWAKSRGLMPKESSGTPGADPDDAEPMDRRGKPASPSAVTEPKLSRGNTGGGVPDSNPKSRFLKGFLG